MKPAAPHRPATVAFDGTTLHLAFAADLPVVAQIRQQSAAGKGFLAGPQARADYDGLIEATPEAPGVAFERASLGTAPGVWVRAEKGGRPTAAMLYSHGGGYVVGSAWAYRHFVSHFVAATGIDAFVLDYPLAPEHPFPAALGYAKQAHAELLSQGRRQIALVGDSAGGGLTLSLLAATCADARRTGGTAPVCAVVMSPWTDLALAGASHTSHADREFYLTRASMQALASQYAGGHPLTDPAVSPLYGDLGGLPPIMLHVGTEEVLLSDTLDYASRARAAGVSVEAHAWEAMPHVFPSAMGALQAASDAVSRTAGFVSGHVDAALAR